MIQAQPLHWKFPRTLFSFFILFTLLFSITKVSAQVEQQELVEVENLGRGTLADAQWNPDGQSILVNTDQGAWLYTPSFQVLAHLEDVQLATFSHSGKSIVGSKVNQSQLMIWDTTTYTLIRTINLPLELPIDAIAPSPDETKIAVGRYQTVEIYTIDGQQSVFKLSIDSPVVSLDWRSDGQILAIGRVGHVDLVDVVQKEIRNSISIDSGNPIPVWSPDNHSLAILGALTKATRSGMINAIQIWDGLGLHLRLVIQAPTARTLVWSPDGSMIGGETYTERDYRYPKYSLSFWDAQTGAVLSTGILNLNKPILSVDWNRDNTEIMIAALDNAVRLYKWPISDLEPTLTLLGHSGAITALSWNPNSTQLVSTSDDSAVRFWDIDTQQEVKQYQAKAAQALSIAWSPDGKQIAIGTNNSAITLIDASSGQETQYLGGSEISVFAPGTVSLAWSADGQFLASGTNEATIQIWEVGSSALIQTVDNLNIPVLSLAWSPDGKQLAYSGNPGGIWNLSKKTSTWICHQDQLTNTITLSPDGNFLVGSIPNGTTCLWDVRKNEIITEKNTYAQELAWSPDQTRIAAIINTGEGVQNRLEIWNALSLDTVTEINTNTRLSAIAWSPDNKYLAAGDAEGKIHIWKRTNL
ncbi:MAG: WD40 repeat domain-containing protein [Chloroflexota bacterium]